MLENRVVIVTGGAGLIGRAFVEAIVESGGTAVIADISAEHGLRVRDKIRTTFAVDRVDFVQVDITSKASLQAMVEELHTRHGRIDALVNNAYPRNPRFGRDFFDVEYEDFCENLNLHVGGYFLASQELARYFQRQGHGNIVNMSSIYGVIAPRFELYAGTSMGLPIEYAAIKSALIHMTRFMAKRFAGMNIRVNTLSPGGILDRQPESFLAAYRARCTSKGMLLQTDLCGTLLYLLSDLSTFVNGQNIVVDDGFTL